MKLELIKENIFPNCDEPNSDSILNFLSGKLIANGFVNKEYKSAIIERESIYPTGLPSDVPAVAIPHADNNLVKCTTIAIATLKTPVSFKNMENTKQDILVSIVIMLAIREPHGQVEMLQRVVKIIQNKNLRKSICEAQTRGHILQLIKPILINKGE